jgi:hypothetical protein
MAQLDTVFDASSVDPRHAYGQLPAGIYRVQIVESDLRITKDGWGKYVYLVMDVLEGDQAGRKIFERLNLVNKNPAAVEIAQRQLSGICHATGQMQVENSEQLHFIPFEMMIEKKRDRKTGEDRFDHVYQFEGQRLPQVPVPTRSPGHLAQTASPALTPPPQAPAQSQPAKAGSPWHQG